MLIDCPKSVLVVSVVEDFCHVRSENAIERFRTPD